MVGYYDFELIFLYFYLVFYFWLCKVWKIDVIFYVGKYGNLEWLLGKSVVFSENCWLDLIFGFMLYLYFFIVNDLGEGI